MTTLGMLQQKMQAGEAGTSLRSFTQNAAKAHEAFQKLALDGENSSLVTILDDNGQMRGMTSIFKDLKNRYGEVLDANEALEIQQAFGTQEALKVIYSLYGQENAFAKNQQAIEDATKSGLSFTNTMAKLADNNFGSRMELASQRISLLKERLGYALIPTLEKLLDIVTPIIHKFTNWIENNKSLAAILGSVILVIGGIAAIAGPALLGIAALVGSFGLLSGAIPAVIVGVKALTAALLFNPIGLIITAIAGAAFLIIKYWQPIKSFFQNLWNKISSIFQAAKEMLIGFLRFSPLSIIKAAWDLIHTA